MPFIEYFQKLPRIAYDITGQGSNKYLTNILSRVRFRQVVESNSVVYYEYSVKDGETPEIIAYNYYGDSGYHWVILIANNIINIYTDWVKSYNDFGNYLTAKYGSDLAPIKKADWTDEELEADPSVVHHFEDYRGRQIDITTYLDQQLNNPVTTKPRYVTYFDYENDLNESKRNIRLPRKEFIEIIDQQMNDLFKEN